MATVPVAASAQPLAVASGDDLTAWQALEAERLRDPEAIAAYRAFVERFPESPLAVVAWGRLASWDAAQPWTDDPSVAPALKQLARRWDDRVTATLGDGPPRRLVLAPARPVPLVPTPAMPDEPVVADAPVEAPAVPTRPVGPQS